MQETGRSFKKSFHTSRNAACEMPAKQRFSMSFIGQVNAAVARMEKSGRLQRQPSYNGVRIYREA